MNVELTTTAEEDYRAQELIKDAFVEAVEHPGGYSELAKLLWEDLKNLIGVDV